jgi:hypothetical protein
MFKCSFCKFEANRPCEWKRHITLLKHQRAIRKNKKLREEEHNMNINLLLELKRIKVILKMNKLEAELRELKQELEGLELETY